MEGHSLFLADPSIQDVNKPIKIYYTLLSYVLNQRNWSLLWPKLPLICEKLALRELTDQWKFLGHGLGTGLVKSYRQCWMACMGWILWKDGNMLEE